jgi:hypothetical protein
VGGNSYTINCFVFFPVFFWLVSSLEIQWRFLPRRRIIDIFRVLGLFFGICIHGVSPVDYRRERGHTSNTICSVRRFLGARKGALTSNNGSNIWAEKVYLLHSTEYKLRARRVWLTTVAIGSWRVRWLAWLWRLRREFIYSRAACATAECVNLRSRSLMASEKYVRL